jgi:hypothetical protein
MVRSAHRWQVSVHWQVDRTEQGHSTEMSVGFHFGRPLQFYQSGFRIPEFLIKLFVCLSGRLLGLFGSEMIECGELSRLSNLSHVSPLQKFLIARCLGQAEQTALEYGHPSHLVIAQGLGWKTLE